ncbi:MAG TPA: polysaccharide biosynthesis/export family protein, partial [Nitrospirales bacterium]|nr:polysaccharide biosynthesis/export family protein [Nitrospirales bacterium]
MRILIVATFIFLSGCNSGWNGLKAVDVSSLEPNGYPAHLGKPKGEVQSIVGGQEQKKITIDDPRYLIKPGDELSIKFFFNPELNEEDLVVRPDGHISLQLVHEVKAADLTPVQLKSLLEKKYEGQLKNPEIAVIVRSVREPYRIYVDGQVRSPGEYEIVGSLSVLQAIARAGGMNTDTAKTGDVKVIRRDQDGQAFVIIVDLDSALSGGDLSQDIRLLPYDFVFV